MLSEIIVLLKKEKNKTLGEKQIYEYYNYRKSPS